MKLTIIRHGESETNSRGLLAGQLDTNLTELGVQQAKLLAERLREEKFDYIYSSDLARAALTTSEIAKYRKCRIEYLSELRAKSFGVYEGLPEQDYMDALVSYGGNPEEFRPIGGESVRDLDIRIRPFIKILEKHDNTSDTILVSSHSSLNRSLLRNLLHLDFVQRRNIKQAGACLNILIGRVVSELKAVTLNCIQHLLTD